MTGRWDLSAASQVQETGRTQPSPEPRASAKKERLSRVDVLRDRVASLRDMHDEEPSARRQARIRIEIKRMAKKIRQLSRRGEE